MSRPIRHLTAAAAAALLLLGGAALPGASALAAGRVDVSFVGSVYSDAGAHAQDEQSNLQAIAAHLQALGSRQLRDGEQLTVEIRDVDLAGRVHTESIGNERRVIRGAADWPRIDLRYVLSAGGRTLGSGSERIADLDYAHRLSGFRHAEPLFYEKRMLEAWLRRTLAEAAGRQSAAR